MSVITVKAIVDDRGIARAFVLDLAGRVANRRDMNQALAERYVEELQDWWRIKDNTPNKLGGERTHFWANAANSTAVGEVTAEGAEVIVGAPAGAQIRVHIFGATILPGKSISSFTGKPTVALAIPAIPAAYGLRPSSYIQKTGHQLFTIPGRNYLFEKTGGARPGGDRPKSVTGRTRDKDQRPTTIPIQNSEEIRGVYLLASRVVVPQDPSALPPVDKLEAALTEEAYDWLDIEGGAR